MKSRDLQKDAPEVARAVRWYLRFGSAGLLAGGSLMGFAFANERQLGLGSWLWATLGMLLLIAGVAYLLLSGAISLWRKFG